MKKASLFAVIILLFGGLLYLSGIYSFAEQINKAKVKLETNSPIKQGGSIIIRLETAQTLENPTLTLNNKSYHLFKQKDNTYRGIVGIDALDKAGQYELKLSDKKGFLNESIPITITNAHFPIQNIVISKKKASLEPTKEELAKVDAAKKNVSSESYWTDKPFIVPVKGCESSVYGVTRYHNGKPTGDYHKGQDIKASQGSPILATAGGKVLIAEQLKLHGGTVSIDHGQGLMSIYIHMSKITVKPGAIIKSGEQIGTVGSTGFATGPHLHWGLYLNGIPVNPTEWVGQINRCK